MGRLDGKVALISGTAGGMGRAAALIFAAEGAKVAGCDLDAEGAAETARLVREAGGDMTSMRPSIWSPRPAPLRGSSNASRHTGG